YTRNDFNCQMVHLQIGVLLNLLLYEKRLFERVVQGYPISPSFMHVRLDQICFELCLISRLLDTHWFGLILPKILHVKTEFEYLSDFFESQYPIPSLVMSPIAL